MHSSWQGLNQKFERLKLAIHVHGDDAKSSVEIVLVDLLECFEYFAHGSVGKMVDCHELDHMAQC